MGRVVGAVGRAGAGPPGCVDQGDLRIWLAAAQMHGGEHTGRSPADDRDAHHGRRLSRQSTGHDQTSQIAAPLQTAGIVGDVDGVLAECFQRHDVESALVG